MRACLAVALLIAASPALAVPELILWQQDDVSDIAGWRLYIQQANEPIARTLEISLADVWQPDGNYGVFIDRDPSTDLFVALVAISLGGVESEPSWSKAYPAQDVWTACHLDFDRDGRVSGRDWGIFRRQFNRECRE